jgi:hypothetical protein
MSMTCQLCEVRYALVDPQRTATGERLFMCLACAAQQPVLPRRFTEGTQRTNVQRELERETLTREVEVAQGRAAVLAMMLRRMVDAFPELSWGLTSAAQQQVLRDVRAVLEESK